jgi:spore coat protein CotH
LGLITPAQAASPVKLTDIYNPLKILKAEMLLPKTSVDSLNSNDVNVLKQYVPGSITFSVDGRTSGLLDIKVRLKGSTSMFKLDETPSFKIKFQKDAAGNGYLGLNRLTLNGMVQDNSKIHEFGAYTLFNAMGVAAPKTGYVHLYINGVDRGLFANIEQPDQIFMQKRFRDITQHIYEGVAFRDLKLGNDNGDNVNGAYLVDYGWKVTPNKRDLTKLINYNSDWEPKTWYSGLTQVIDRSSLIKAFAVESFLSHWDGYSGPDVNNYFLRSNTKSKFTYIPWGVDQTFGENRQTEVLGDEFNVPLVSDTATQPWANNRQMNRGQLYVKCINYKPCRTEYLLALKDISAIATKIKLGTQMKAVANVINPTLTKQFAGDPATLSLIKSEQTRSIAYIAKRQSTVASTLKRYGVK